MTAQPLVDSITPQALNTAGLRRLPSSVAAPTYDRDSLTPAVVHIGVGDRHVFGDLAGEPGFVASVESQLVALDKLGVREAIRCCLRAGQGARP
jgi:hypothetical protein